ncbi:MAG TPA: ATP-binding cassette domain-containing protein, partial [Thermoguttaceae bacterium]|nr:ATP-binding cassette domain-containing protein [Thermoguttaceae bacterium]
MSQFQTDPSPAVSIEDVSFSFGSIPVLEQVNVSIARGESISIVGPNGGGKTTLLRLILGLLRPDAGRIEVFGRSPVDARLRMGYMPQRAEHDPQFPVTVMDVVLMGCLGRPGPAGLMGWYGSAGRRDALEALDRMGMADLRRRSFAA